MSATNSSREFAARWSSSVLTPEAASEALVIRNISWFMGLDMDSDTSSSMTIGIVEPFSILLHDNKIGRCQSDS
jgi:hypothetical protein